MEDSTFAPSLFPSPTPEGSLLQLLFRPRRKVLFEGGIVEEVVVGLLLRSKKGKRRVV